MPLGTYMTAKSYMPCSLFRTYSLPCIMNHMPQACKKNRETSIAHTPRGPRRIWLSQYSYLHGCQSWICFLRAGKDPVPCWAGTEGLLPAIQESDKHMTANLEGVTAFLHSFPFVLAMELPLHKIWKSAWSGWQPNLLLWLRTPPLTFQKKKGKACLFA